MYLATLTMRNLWQRIRRHPILAVAATAFILLLVTGCIVHWLAVLHYHAAKTALAEGELESARNQLSLCRLVWPGNVDTLLLSARIERLDGKYKAAETYLSECKWWQGGASEQTQFEGTLLRTSAGGLIDAEGGLYHAVQVNDPGAPLILETLAICYARQGQNQFSMRALDQWLQLEPNNLRALHMRADLNIGSNNMENARLDLRKLVRLAPNNRKYRLRYTSFLLDENNLDEAALQLESLQKAYGADPEVLLNLARYHFAKGQLDEARKRFQQLLDGEPDNWQAMFYLARLENQAGHPAVAEKWARAALDREPGNNDIHVALFKALRSQPNKSKEAKEQGERQKEVEKYTRLINQIFTQDLQRSGHTPDLYAKLGDAFLHLNMNKTGLYWLEAALRKDPNQPTAHVVLARYYETQGEPELAAQHRKKAGKEPEKGALP
jgi:Tfp pilus assembly protein PilF